MTRPLLVRCAAEVAGTALLVGIGTGAIVAGANAGGVPQWILAIAWFFAVLVPVLAFARLSGSHINPVVTLALVSSRRFPAGEAPPYVAAQVGGAFLGSALVGLLLGTAAHLGATTPHGIGLVEVFLLEFGFTLSLVLVVLYLTRPGARVPLWEAVLPALVVGVSTELIGPLTGSSLNPARTLAPAVLSHTYTAIAIYFLAAVVASLVGVALVALVAPQPSTTVVDPR